MEQNPPKKNIALKFSINFFFFFNFTIRVPVHMVEVINKATRCNRKLVQELGREPTVEEIAAELNLPVEKIIEANRTAADTLSLDTPVGDEEDTSIGSFVEDDRTAGPGECRAQLTLAQTVL